MVPASNFNLIVAVQCNLFFFFPNSIKGGHDRSSSTETGDGSEIKHHVPHHAPCFVDDIFTALRESRGNDGELTNHSLALFGICTVPGYSSGSVLLELAKETNRNQRDGLELLHPAGGKKKCSLTAIIFV